MTEQLAAACDSCGRKYRVPSASKTYSCKACESGRVRVLTKSAPARTKDCAACGEELHADAKFCVGCGSQVADSKPARRTTTRNPDTDSANRTDDKRRASAEIMRSAKRVGYIRKLLFFNAFFAALTLCGVVFFGSLVVDSFTELLPILLIYATTLSVSVAGIMNMRSNPMPWVLGVAGLWTLGFLLRLVNEGMPTPGSLILSLIWGGCLWGALIPAMRLNKLVKQHPDLYAAHRARGTTGERMIGGTEAERVAHGKRVMRATSKKSLVTTCAVVLGIYAVSLLGSYAIYADSHTPGPEEALADFASAWANNDADAIAALTSTSRAATCRKRLVDGAASYKWSSWPTLIEVDRDTDEDRIEAEYDIGVESGNMHVLWRAHDGDWVLTSIALPTPELGNVPQQFRDLWNRQDLDGIAEMFHSEDSERTSGKLKRMLAKRGWDTECPKVDSFRAPQLYRPGSVEVSMQLSTGQELGVIWKHEDGRWRISKLKPPTQ